MPDEQSIHCPLCGKKVPSDIDKCPFCSTHIDTVMLRREVDRVIERRLMRKLKSSSEDSPAPPVPSAPIPEVKVTCPGCGLELKGGEAKCSRCGIPLAVEDELLECPDCGATFAPGAKACPKCGVSFADEEEEPAPPEVPEPRAVRIREAHEVSPPAEVVTAVPPEPVSMGRGLTNGRGAINGTGLVNGTGMINGTKVETPLPSPSRKRGFPLARWQFLAVLVALVILIPTFIYIAYSKEDSPFSVDGDFGEWADVDSYGMTILAEAPLTIVDEWSVGVDDTRVYLFVSSVGDIFGTTGVESFFLFVDSDGDPETGYAMGAMGAEFMIELDGWNDSIQSSGVSVYDPSSDDERYDWNSWESVGGAVGRLSGSRLEAMGNIQEVPSSDARFMLLSQDQLARRSVSSSVPLEGGVLIVTQSLSPSVPLSGLLPSSASTPILTLTFTCDGTGGTVSSVDLELENLEAPVIAFEPLTLQPGDVETVDFEVDTSSVSSGQFVSAFVTEAGITSDFASVVVVGHPARAYAGSAPATVNIDGAFGDWYGRTASDVDLVDVPNPNIDITQVGVFNTSVSSSFYIRVDGEMCSGSYVPIMKGKPIPSDGGSVVPVTRKTAEDVTWIFIDGDMSAATGYPVSVDTKVIGADYRVEVRGLNGEVVSSVLHSYTGTTWTLLSSSLDVEVDGQRMEVGVLSYQIGNAEAIDFIIETTDWRQYKDYVGLDEATMLALTGGLSSLVGTMTWAVDSATTSSMATDSSFQRKLFYDGTNYWSLFYDGSNTVYKYSANGGVSWTSCGSVFTTTGIVRSSLWYNSSSNLVYVVGDNFASSVNVYVRRGTVNPSGPSISWGTENTVPVSTEVAPQKNASITLGVNGYVWIAGSSKVSSGATNLQYNVRTYRSPTVGDVSGTWSVQGPNLLDQKSDSTTPCAVILPGKSGTGIVWWAVVAFDGRVTSRTYDGSTLSSYTTVYAAGASVANTVSARPSAVIDSSGVVHVVYGTGHMYGGVWKAHIQYAYSTSVNSWSTPIDLNATGSTYGNRCPSISLDTSTGNVYAMWIQDTSNTIYVKKNVSGSWTQVSAVVRSSTVNHLTAIYSVSGEAYLCWQWTEGSSSPYTVVFDKIPEFSDVALPVFFVLTVFIAVYRRRARPDAPV